ncbi:MAG: RNA-binding cell elongation regulator Jag/EloR [Chloroflexota bacterium]
MNESVNRNQVQEFHDLDVESAIEAGLEALDLDRDQVEIEIVQSPARGVLGLGAKGAIVRLHPLVLEEPEQEATAPDDSLVEPEEIPQIDIEQLTLEVANDLIELMEIDADIDVQIKTEEGERASSMVVEFYGNDLGFLIGRRGETMLALQHIMRLIINKQVRSRVNLMVDVEGYRSRREEALNKLAVRVADQVTRKNRAISLEPMSSYDRRVVHICLRNHPTVYTESVGEGDRRKVTIYPKNS